MAAEQSPAYQWYVKDWRSSRKVQLMSWKVRGMYREMLDEQWDSAAGLPNDPAALTTLLGGAETDWVKHLPQIRGCFTVQPDGTLLNLRLEKERVKQRKRSGEGKAGGKARSEAAGRSESGRFQPADTPPTAGEPSSGDAGEPPDMHLLLHLPIAVAGASGGGEQAIVRGSHRISPAPSPEIAMRAGLLVERYSELFYEHRRGARLKAAPALDFPKACELVTTWTDEERLEKLAVLILTTDDEWISQTDRSFGIFAMKATWADVRLAEWEAKQKSRRA